MTGGEPSIGDVLDDRYRILGKLGSGGMGSVYRAEHVGIRRPVAVKLLHPSIAEDPEFARRFEREALVTGRTSHPNCVTVSDFGKLDDGAYYLVMELVDGVLLADLLDEQQRLPVARALHIARHLLHGLAHVHAAGIVHRDIKPSNVILVDQHGDRDFAKLLDFGIAKIIEVQPGESIDNSLTRVGIAVGTPTYVAPEQALGGEVDGRSDLYSLSVVLYMMLTGEPPFRDQETLKLLAKHLSAPVPAMSTIASDLDVSDEVEAMVRKGLAKDRSDRWPDARSYAAAIDDIVARGAATTARKASGTGPLAAYAGAPGQQTSTSLIGGARKGRRLWIGGAAVAAVAGVVAVAASQGGGAGGPGGGLGSVAALDPARAALLGKVDALLEAGRAGDAIALVEAEDELASSAAGQLRLGHALAATDRPRDAVVAYRRAIELDGKRGKTREDQVLRANLATIARRRDPAVALPALGLLVEGGDDDARATLIELAGKDKRAPWRAGAREIALRAGLADDVDLLASYLLDLHQGRTCEERRKVVPLLVELGDARAIPWLEKARRRTSGGVLGIGASSANGCMRRELDEAIAALTPGD